MNSKAWTASDIRSLARQTVDGRQQLATARGAYFRALVETAQTKPGSKAGQKGQRTAVRAVHREFYPIIQKTIATDAILVAAGFPPKGVALERNRRLNFARSAHGTIQRWLRADGHDLMKLDPLKVTKSQLLSEAPPTRQHALTPKRIKARADKLIGGLLTYTRQIAKVDPVQATNTVNDALEQLIKLSARIGVERKTTTDATVASREMRPLRVGSNTYWPIELPIAK